MIIEEIRRRMLMGVMVPSILTIAGISVASAYMYIAVL